MKNHHSLARNAPRDSTTSASSPAQKASHPPTINMITGFLFKPSASDLHLNYAFYDFSGTLRLPKKLRCMKRFFSKRGQDKAAAVDDANNSHIPHLVRKKRQKKKRKSNATRTSRPFTRAFVLEDFSNPALPRVLLHPPTPADNKFNLEDYLFERCGSVFVLREPQSQPEVHAAPGDWWLADYLQVPPEYREVAIDVYESPEKDDVEKGLLENEEVHSVYLDEDCEADYRAYMDGLYELI